MNHLSIYLSLFLIISIGVLSGRLKIFNSDMCNIINKFLFNIAIPSLIILTITNISIKELSLYPTFIKFNFILNFLYIVIVFFLLRITKLTREIRGAIFYASTVGNTVYFGFPILSSLFGMEHLNLGVIYLIISLLIADIFSFLLLELDMESKKNFRISKYLKNIFTQPLIISTVIGILCFSLNFHLPNFLKDSLDTLGKTTPGLSLLSLGIYISNNLKIRRFFICLFISSVKLIIFPLLVYLLSHNIFHFANTIIQVSVILSAMPSAIFSIIISDIYKLDSKLASDIVILSTILSIITSFVWIEVLI